MMQSSSPGTAASGHLSTVVIVLVDAGGIERSHRVVRGWHRSAATNAVAKRQDTTIDKQRAIRTCQDAVQAASGYLIAG